MELLLNRVYCKHCDTTITSRHRHNFVGCNCTEEDKKIFIDGGLVYNKILVRAKSDYENLSVYNDNNHSTVRENLEWGVNFDKDQNRLPETIYKPIKDLNSDHIEEILKKGYTKGLFEKAFKDELEYRSNERPQTK